MVEVIEPARSHAHDVLDAGDAFAIKDLLMALNEWSNTHDAWSNRSMVVELDTGVEVELWSTNGRWVAKHHQNREHTYHD